MKLDHYISELLHEHDCVIVTDLGGFIASYRPASINPALHVLSPPSKRIAFNSSLKNNDGLLASYISNKSALNYSDACEIIRDYARQATHHMDEGRRLKIDNIGVLFMDSDKNLQFLPDTNMNYLVSSFGLTSVHAPVIKRENTVIHQQASKTKKESKIKAINPKSGQKGWTVLEVIPAAAILTFLLLVPPVLNEFNSNLSTLLPFSRMNEYIHQNNRVNEQSQKVTINYPSPFEIPPARIHNNVEQTSVESARAIILEEPVIEEIKTNEVAPVVIPEITHPKPSIEVSQGTSAKKQYHIIGGCFRLEDNAHNFISELKKQGIEAEIIGQNSGGLFMVSVFNSDSFPQVSDALPEIKSSVVSSAWVYKK